MSIPAVVEKSGSADLTGYAIGRLRMVTEPLAYRIDSRQKTDRHDHAIGNTVFCRIVLVLMTGEACGCDKPSLPVRWGAERKIL